MPGRRCSAAAGPGLLRRPAGGLERGVPLGASVAPSGRGTRPWCRGPGRRENALQAEARPAQRPTEETPRGRGRSRGLRVTGPPHPADTCGADCTRKRAEQSLQAAIRTLRKSISRQQFSVQVADTEYEVAQRPAKAPEGPGACSTGQVLQDGKCGESLPWPLARRLCPSSHAWPGRQAHQDGAGTQPARGRCHGTCRDGVTQRAPAGPRPWTRLPLSGSSCI